MAETEPSPRDTEKGHADLAQLNRRLSEVEGRRQKQRMEAAGPATNRRSLGKAWSLAIEMVAAVGVSVFIGWWLDRWLETAPFGVVGFALLGVAAAMWIAIRTGMAMNRQAMEDEQSAPDADDKKGT
ncbi:AtpZ/AtpI family protein [Ferrovibrio sp.]|uniref:AtpZ/AtpI family protein n=1 Tax=Ferrovibrio sp. TaxID=1917215 RepID=UPI0035B4B1DF